MGKIKKILVVSSTYPVTEKDTVPRFVKDQITAFTQLDKRLEIIVLSPHNQSSRYRRYPKKTGRIIEERFHYLPPAWERLTDRGIMPALKTNPIHYFAVPFLIAGESIATFRMVKKYKPNLIYAHWFTPQAIAASIAQRLTRTSFVFTTHASDVDVWRRFGWLGKKIVRIFTKNASAITAVSTQTRKKLTYFFDTSPPAIAIIPMGIHIPKNNPAAINERGARKLLFIGRLTEKKGLQNLLPAIIDVIKKFPDTQLTIAGDGEMRKELETLVQTLGLQSSVRFLGFVTGHEKQDLFLSHTFMVVPSIVTKLGDSEGLPVSLMEGMGHGMICIATQATGAKDIIKHGQNGFIVEKTNNTALRDSLIECLSMKKPSLSVVSNNAFESAKKLHWSHIAQRHLYLFEKSLETHP